MRNVDHKADIHDHIIASELGKRHRMTMVWAPRHEVVLGNEGADFRAKAVIEGPSTSH